MRDTQPPQEDLDQENAEFWTELCGTSLAQSLDIQGDNPDDLGRFDSAYLGMYPYLTRYLDNLDLDGTKTLEIGLGYGTLGSVIARRSAAYYGLDIAPGAVAMMRHRLRLVGHESPEAVVAVGSALALPYPNHSFDRVVTIGCLHHTGDLATSLREIQRVLVPGGRALVMVYNRHSFRKLVEIPARRFVEFLSGRRFGASRERALYDTNSKGAAAPHTDFVSRRELRLLLSPFSRARIESQNADPLHFRGRQLVSRERLLGPLGRTLGLDLYALIER